MSFVLVLLCILFGIILTAIAGYMLGFERRPVSVSSPLPVADPVEWHHPTIHLDLEHNVFPTMHILEVDPIPTPQFDYKHFPHVSHYFTRAFFQQATQGSEKEKENEKDGKGNPLFERLSSTFHVIVVPSFSFLRRPCLVRFFQAVQSKLKIGGRAYISCVDVEETKRNYTRFAHVMAVYQNLDPHFIKRMHLEAQGCKDETKLAWIFRPRLLATVVKKLIKQDILPRLVLVGITQTDPITHEFTLVLRKA